MLDSENHDFIQFYNLVWRLKVKKFHPSCISLSGLI